MILFTKVWNEKIENNARKFGSKEYYFDPRVPIIGFEACRLKDDKGKEIECTKIFYSVNVYITLKGDPLEFMQKIKDANIAITLLADLYAANYTIKQFMEETERKNNIILQ